MIRKIIQNLDSNFNLKQLGKIPAYCGNYKGFKFTIKTNEKNYSIAIPAKLTQTYTLINLSSFLDNLANECNGKIKTLLEDTLVYIDFMPKGKTSVILENLNSFMYSLFGELEVNGATPCCVFCGEAKETSPFIISGESLVLTCSDCVEEAKAKSLFMQEQAKDEPPNIRLGITGAILGGLLGIIAWTLISLEYSSFFSGSLLAIFTIEGYLLFKGKVRKNTIIILSILLPIFSCLAAYTNLILLSYINFNPLYDITLLDCIKDVNYILSLPEVRAAFLKELFKGLLACGILAFSLLKKLYKEHNHIVDVKEVSC